MDRYITGLATNRSALRDAEVPYLQAKYQSGTRYDSIIDGLNMEVSVRSTLIRRPGHSVYNSQIFPPISRFYDFRTVVDGQDVIHVMADTAGAVYDGTGPSTKLNIWTKASGAGKTCFQSVGNTLYFSNLLENKKWMLSPKAWAAGRTFQPGDWIVDPNNNIQLIQPQKMSSIASIQVSDNVLTVMLQGPDDFPAGATVTFAGLTLAAFLNGQSVVPSTLAIANGFQAPFTNADYALTTDTGTATSGGGAASTGANQPGWSTTIGAITGDGGLQWICWGSSVQNWGITGPAVAPTVVQTTLPGSYPSWTANTIYSTSLAIVNSAGAVQKLVKSGVTGAGEPAWSNTAGALTTDGTAQWKCLGSAAWQASTVHAAGDIISVAYTYYVTIQSYDDDPSGDAYRGSYSTQQVPVTETDLFLCTTAGTTGATAPAWGPGQGLTVQDGSCVWTNQGATQTWTSLVGASDSVSLASRIVDANGNLQTLVASGKSGAAAPTWSTNQGQTTTDGSAVWTESGPYSAANSFQQLWGYAYKNSIDNTISTVSPISVPVVVGTNKIATLQAPCSTDPQVDTIVIYRTVQNGSTLLELDEIPQPKGTTWLYNDTSPDSALIVQLQAARNSTNNPPPIGIQALSYHLGRVWAAIGNLVQWSTGPDATVGNGNNAWSPGNVAPFPDSARRLVPVTLTNGALLVFTASDLYAIFGNGQAGNAFQPIIYGQGIGLLNHDALDIIGATIHLFTTARKQISLDPSAGYTETGFIIGDQFKLVDTGGINKKLYDPATAQVTWHESESEDTGLYVADGAVGWFRYSPISQPETGFLWSPRAAIQGGTSAVRSIETAPGLKQLLVGPAVSGPILFRDLTLNSDAGVAYANTYATIGSIQLCLPYELCEVAGVVIDSIRVGTPPTIGILYGEIYATAEVPFELYERTCSDPPNLPDSETLNNDRFVMLQNGSAPLCRHMQLLIQFSSEDDPGEVLTHTVYGAKHSERKVA